MASIDDRPEAYPPFYRCNTNGA